MKMIDCAQLRLELLRHHVRQNHHQDNLQTQAIQSAARTANQSPVSNNDFGPITAAFNNQTRAVLFQLTNTNRPFSMSRFTVTPVKTNNQNVPISKTQEKKQTNNRMLHVRVHDELKAEQKAENCSGSPSDSIDSGMPSSPAYLTTEDEEDSLSPLPSAHPVISNRFHFAATAHASPTVQPQFRNRSSSECLDFRQESNLNSSTKTLTDSNNGSSNSSLSPNGTPLRSILKKPKTLAPGLGSTTIVAASTNGLRRAPTRYVLSRSVSECQDDQVLNDLQLAEDEVVSMEDLTVANGSPLSVCPEVDEESCDSNSSEEPMKPSAEQQRKKRVSFNEQVLARIYRSNSSIIATKNKQERKIRNRLRRRAESESSDQQPINIEELIRIPTIPLCKLSAEEKVDENAPNCEDDHKDSAPVNERRDSGFDSTDSGMESPPEELQRVDEEPMHVELSPKRVQRVISSDSAFGDEPME